MAVSQQCRLLEAVEHFIPASTFEVLGFKDPQSCTQDALRITSYIQGAVVEQAEKAFQSLHKNLDVLNKDFWDQAVEYTKSPEIFVVRPALATV